MRGTAAAEILTETAEQVLDQLNQAEHAAAASSQGLRHVVRLSVCDYNSYHWLPGLLDWFRVQHPDIEVEIEPSGTDAALKRLAQRHLDIVIFPDAVDVSTGQGEVLFPDELVVAVWPGHRFVRQPFVAAADFSTETYLTYSLAGRPEFESELLWSQGNALPLRKRNLGSVEAVCELIKAKAGVSVLSKRGIHREISAGTLAYVPAGETGLSIEWRVITPSDATSAAPARLTTDALKAWFRSAEPSRCGLDENK